MIVENKIAHMYNFKTYHLPHIYIYISYIARQNIEYARAVLILTQVTESLIISKWKNGIIKADLLFDTKNI
jgi:hypothetical protein